MTERQHPLVGAMRLRGLTVAQLAEMTGLTRYAIYLLIAGKRRPSADTVARLSRALGMTELADQLAPWVEIGRDER